MTGVKLKELFYYIFFGLMAAAKGIGLDSGDKLYYVLSIAALICIVCKICMTKYCGKELAAIGMLGILALAAYWNSGRLGIVLSVLAIVGMKDIQISKTFRLGLSVYGSCFVFTVLLAANGMIDNPMVVHEKAGIGEIIRWGMGYSTGNVFHISYFILVVFIVYNLQINYRFKNLCILMLGNLLVFVFSLSYTGIAVTTFYLFVSYYAVKRTEFTFPEKVLCRLPLPLCIIFSIGMPFLSGSPFGQKLDAMLQARLSFSYYYLTNQPITLFGTRMKEIPNFWIIMDNGYVYILMTYGIIVFLLFAAGYTILIKRYCQSQGGRIKLAIIFSFLLYGIMEQFISNAFMNISLLFMGEILYGTSNCREESFSSIRVLGKKWTDGLHYSGKRIFIAGGMGASLFLAFYALEESKPEYVEVPITSLNYVEAQSVILHVEDPFEDKEDLKKVLEQYEKQITDVQFMNKVYQEIEAQTEKKDIILQLKNINPEEIKEMFELSLPQYIHASGIYDTFRLRLLKSSPDWKSEVYHAVLEETVKQMHLRMPQVSSESVIEETVGKSFGTDRIEHFTNKEKYVVEKKGIILTVEIIRNGILQALTGALLGSAAVIGIVSIWSIKRYT